MHFEDGVEDEVVDEDANVNCHFFEYLFAEIHVIVRTLDWIGIGSLWSASALML